jgi:hypothetical protein
MMSNFKTVEIEHYDYEKGEFIDFEEINELEDEDKEVFVEKPLSGFSRKGPTKLDLAMDKIMNDFKNKGWVK